MPPQSAHHEPERCDILVAGTGYFAEIMLFDIASTAKIGLNVVVGGRNEERMRWLVNGVRARAAIYGTPVRCSHVELDMSSAHSLMPVYGRLQPRVLVQSASVQSPWKVDIADSDWSRLVATAGFGITLAFHCVLAWRSALAIKAVTGNTHFVNTCYPDGVNAVLRAGGLPITTGVGNAGIFSAMIGGRLLEAQRTQLRVLAHHQHLVQWRRQPGTRTGSPVRAWVADQELEDVEAMTQDIQLPYRDLNAVSGASAVPVLLGLLGQRTGRQHVPGPGGRPGGYPVQVDETGVFLDLPPGIDEHQAIEWNRQFEAADGVSVTSDGEVCYSDRASQMLREVSPDLAQGFAVCDVEEATQDLGKLRERLGG